MKALSILPLLFAFCVATAVPPSSRDYHPRLQKRAQQLTNPDNEPDFEDPLTKSKTAKSRVLSIDDQDTPATKRWFDWDESCANEFDRKKGSKVNTDNRNYIVQEDPAFTQMFNAEDIRIPFVKESFDLIQAKMQSFDGRNDQKPNAVRFICDPKGEVKDAHGKSYCGTGKFAAQAVTNNAANHGIIEPKYSFESSASIVFCPLFFDDAKFPNIDVLVGISDTDLPKTLATVDCRERILLHEFLHLRFVRNFSGKVDNIGFFDAAKTATLGWGTFKLNPDSYAWYALYSYWNNKDGGCTQDVWPADTNKPIK